jgi:hypothetical protein
MADLSISGHKLQDALWNIEYRNRKRSPMLEADGSVSSTPVLGSVNEAPTCLKGSDCLWNHVVLESGEPCNKCRFFNPGEYYRKA